jgi:hypothetical protein
MMLILAVQVMMLILAAFSGISAFCGSGSIGEGGGVSDGRRSQRFNIVSLLVFESFTSNFKKNVLFGQPVY